MAWEAAASQAIFLGCPIPPYALDLLPLRTAAELSDAEYLRGHEAEECGQQGKVLTHRP
jgi:hypothetical protein